MSPVTLDCDSLSVRQRELNIAVNEAYKNKLPLHQVLLSDGQTDVDNIYKIDLASKYRNVDYIIENLKSTDSLRVARALKARWLFTDNLHSDIINPTYISTTLQPFMSDKAFNKFMSRLACCINDEKRCQEFYMYSVQLKNERYMEKFLLKCSIPFIISRIASNDIYVSPQYLLSLSLKSQEILAAYIQSNPDILDDHIYALRHLIDMHGDFYLDLLENHILRDNGEIHLGQRVTREILRNHKERIFKQPYIYVQLLHFKQLAHELTQDEVKHLAILVGKYNRVWGNDVLQSLINLLPSDERYTFIKSLFKKFFPDQDFEMDRDFTIDHWYKYMSYQQREEWALRHIAQHNEDLGMFYQWYKFVGFKTTFVKLKKLLRAEPDASERESMFQILVSTCDDDESNIQKLLKYFHDRHINEIILFKQHIIGRIMEDKNIYKCGDKVWKILTEILLSLRIYEDVNDCSDSFKEKAAAHIIIHHIIYDKPITEKMYKLYARHYSMLSMMITTPWKEKVFGFLYKLLVASIKGQDLQDSNGRDMAVNWTNELIRLIRDWEHPVHPEVVGLIRKIRVHDSNALSHIIRDEMFKDFFPVEQPLPHLDEDICLQKLKKDVVLLDSCKAQFDAKIQSNTMRYRKFLSKIRIYFGKDLALEWRKYYLDKLKENLKDSTGCACVLFGLSILLPAAEYEELTREYQPKNAKLVWSESDPCLVHIQTNIAKFMHLVRPVVNQELLTSFAKGDFLQYAVNSLMSVGRQLTQEDCRELILKLLASPISLQKHGIRLVVKKFTMEELIDIFGKMWVKSENVSIRKLLYSYIHDLLSVSQDDTKCLDIWKLLSMIMTQLHGNEFLTNIVDPCERNPANVSLSVRPQYCAAYWHLLQTVQECQEIWTYRTEIIVAMTDDTLLNLLDEGLLEGLILNVLHSLVSAGANYVYPYSFMVAFWCLIAKFVILCETKEIAERRKEDVLTIATQYILSNWNVKFTDYYITEMFKRFLNFLLKSSEYVLYTDEELFCDPLHVLEYIQKEFNSKLSEIGAYEYRLWLKLAIILVKSLSESRELEPADRYDDRHLRAEVFGKRIIELMRSETAENYPGLPQLFGHYLNKFVYHECFDAYIGRRDHFYIELSKVLLKEKEDIYCLILVIECLNQVTSYSALQAEAVIMRDTIKKMNIPDLNHFILYKHSGSSPFGYL